MDKQTQLWNEYQSLRSEMTQADTLNYQTMGGLIAVSGGILTAGFNQVNPSLKLFVFLCVYSVTIPGYRLLQGNRRRIWRISTYIRTFLEPNFEFIQWETRLEKSRRLKTTSQRQSLSSLVGTNEWFIITLLDMIAGLGAIIALIQIYSASQNQWCIVGIVAIVLLNILWLFNTLNQEAKLRRLGTVEQNFLDSWQVLAESNLPKTEETLDKQSLFD
ncbi:MAG: hypothetical protein ACK456_00545 [Pseudanabaenaceae cyanobacterium]|jgi:hypothetical protein